MQACVLREGDTWWTPGTMDPWYHCRPSGLLGILQEAAVAAACELHASREEMMDKYNCSGCWPGCGTGWTGP